MYQIVTFLSAREPEKLKIVGNTWFFDELGPLLMFFTCFFVFVTCCTDKISEFQLITSKFSAFSCINTHLKISEKVP